MRFEGNYLIRILMARKEKHEWDDSAGCPD